MDEGHGVSGADGGVAQGLGQEVFAYTGGSHSSAETKAGNDRFYEEYVPMADDIYDEHLDALRKEGLIE